MARLIKSFLHALRGLFFALRYERNLQIHIVLAFLVIILAFLFKLTLWEFIILIIIIIFVLIAELLNTIIELVIDYINPRFNQRARLIKDLSAGTVLIVALGSILLGMLIFYPHLKEFFIK